MFLDKELGGCKGEPWFFGFKPFQLFNRPPLFHGNDPVPLFTMKTKYPWIIYDCSVVPNKFRCLICGANMIVTSPARLSTYIVVGEQFANEHGHGDENDKTNKERTRDFQL